ncbi:hypothetical protein [Lacisediminimonas profundi]|uniref:hypothetical protein n=1 Tax=Lacisediminimonas profundi TaxID=2603856 RepID=UPI00124B5FC1|nr:hypothetical protein [Lacisediminimonas profundi]
MDRNGILVATLPIAHSAACEALAGTYPVTFAETVEQASRLIRSRRFQLIVVTLQFDDSQPFELLPAAKDSGTPIILAKLLVSVLPAGTIAAAFRSARVLGFDGCIDLQLSERTSGRDEAIKQFRDLVMSLALPRKV